MAIVLTDDKHYKDIADVIRNEAGAGDAKFRPEQMAAEIKGACDYKYYEGHLAGNEEGFTRGKQAEYDAFWDAYQNNGNRTDYLYAFSYSGWNSETFKPKYNMQPTSATQMFYHFGGDTSIGKVVDLVALLDELNVTLDFSKATSMSYCFQNSRITHLGVIDLSSCKNVITAFCNMYGMQKIDKIIVNENNVFDDACFSNCPASSITFEGTIASNLNLGRGTSPPQLNKASIVNVFNCLSDVSTSKTLTFKTSVIQKAFETSSGAKDGNTSEEWLNLVATKPNWTITLA